MKRKGFIFGWIFILGGIFQSSLHGQELIWSDEFDYTGLPDSTRWTYDSGGHGWGNNEKQYYTFNRLENARVENGMLVIEARKEGFSGSEYTSARLKTKNRADWLYGRIEVRAKIPGGNGAWPAIWMLPTESKYGRWPKSGEIDIMEHVGYDTAIIHGTVHTEAFNHTLGTQKGNRLFVADANTAFHLYAIEWNASRIDFYVDETCYFSYENSGKGSAEWPFDQTFHLLLNIAVGGNWGGAKGIDNSIFPVQMVVDYVRVFR